MTRVRLSFLLIRITTWSQIGTAFAAAASGVVYLFALFLQSPLLTVTQEIAEDLISIFLYVFIALILSRLIMFAFAKLRDRNKSSPERGLVDRLQYLGNRVRLQMGVGDGVGFTVRRDFRYSFLRKARVVVGDKLVESMTDEELTGIIGHELAHFALRHHIKRIRRVRILSVVVIFFVLSSLFPPLFISLGTLLGIIFLLGIRSNWRREYQADSTAAAKLGPATVLRGFSKFRGYGFDGFSVTHPPLSRRITILQSTLEKSSVTLRSILGTQLWSSS